MSQNRTFQGARQTGCNSGFELRLSSAVVCGISAFVLQAAALERAPFCAAPLEEGQASSSPDPDSGRPVPSVATRRGQALLGNAPPQGGPAASGVPLPDCPESAGTSARESALAAAALAARRRLAAHPLRGPPRLPS